MKGMTRGWGLVLAMAAAIHGAPAEAQDKAQQAAEPEVRAKAHTAHVADFDKAASLYRKAAGLRLEGDPQGIRNLLHAGRLSYYTGAVARAADDLARAGRIAMEYGDVTTAVKAYLDAAWAADAAGDGAEALEFATRAQRLAQSPLLAHEQRSALLSRIDFGTGQ